MAEPPPDDELRERLGRYFDEIGATPAPPAIADVAAASSLAAARRRRRLTGGVVAAAAAVLVLALAWPGDDPTEQQLSTDSTPGSTAAPTTAVAPTTDAGGPTTTASAAPTTAAPPTTGGTSPTSSTAAPGPSVVVPPPLVPPPLPPPSSTSSTSTSTTTSLPPSNLLVSEDFESTPVGSLPAGWSTDSGSWRVTAGPGGDHQASNTTPGTAEGRLSAGAPAVSDAEAVAGVRFGAGGQLGGVALRYQGPDDYLFCKIDHVEKRLYLGVFAAGAPTVLRQLPFDSVDGALHVLTFRAVASSLTCSVAGGPSLTATDATFGPGRVALLGHGDTSIASIVATRR